MRYEKLELVFKSPSGKVRALHFDILPIDVAQRWGGLLARHLVKKSRIEKGFLLHGWLTKDRNLPFLFVEMNRNIRVINEFFERHPKLPLHIPLHFTGQTADRQSLNKLHSYFEQLIGQVWNFAPYYMAASLPVRYAILQINYLCHEIEALERSLICHSYQRVDAHVCLSMTLTKRVLLSEKDYELFSPFTEWGDVYLHYAQLGKQHLDAFHDDDLLVQRENISGLRYLSGEFDIDFSDSAEPASQAAMLARFHEWLKKNNYDPADKKLGIGRLVVAKVASNTRGHHSTFDFMNALYEYDDLCEIALYGGGKKVSCQYPYSWRDVSFEREQIRGLRDSWYESIDTLIRSFFPRA
jgi:hypothetical protein